MFSHAGLYQFVLQILTKHVSFVAFYLRVTLGHQRVEVQGNRVEALCRCMLKLKYSCRALHSNPLQQTELLICKYFWYICISIIH